MKLVSKKNGTTTIFPSLISAIASKIGFTPPTGMSATNVQDGIEEVYAKTKLIKVTGQQRTVSVVGTSSAASTTFWGFYDENGSTAWDNHNLNKLASIVPYLDSSDEDLIVITGGYVKGTPAITLINKSANSKNVTFHCVAYFEP